MITLKIDNSESSIIGLTIIQFKALRDLMSYAVPSQTRYFSGGYFSQKRTLLDKRGTFPTGLLYIAEKYLKDRNIEHSIIDTRVLPKRSKMPYKLRLPFDAYPEQQEAAKACLEHSRGVIRAPTGSGKSAIVALIIEALEVPTLVIVPTLELKRQLTEFLSNAFHPSMLGNSEHTGYIRVENIDALATNKLITGYDCVIIDEFHHSGAKTYRKLNKKSLSGVYYKFGLTATFFRSQEHERLLLESVLSKVIYSISYKDSVLRQRIVPLEAYSVSIPSIATKSVAITKYAAAYSQLIVNNKERNDIIHDLLVKFHAAKLSTLCLVKEIAHGNILTRLASVPFVNGQDEDFKFYLDKFNSAQLNVLIGTHGVLGEGVDTKPCEYVIIASPMKSRNLFMQCVGRAFRRYNGKESAKIILLEDKSHKWFKNAYKEQCKILLEEYGVKVVKLK